MNYEFISITAKNKKDVFTQIAKYAKKKKYISDENVVITELLKREKISTTAFEDGVAIPHARIDQILRPVVYITRIKKEFSWPALDNKPTKVAIALLIPSKSFSMHIDVLASISTKLLDENNRRLFKFGSSKKILEMLNSKKEPESKKAIMPKNKNSLKIVGVTACTTGIAHTYMAKDALEKLNQNPNYTVNIETQGQKGADDILTNEQIKAADYVIIAADIDVKLDRFNGKKIYITSTTKAIKDANNVIMEAKKNAKVYDSEKISKNDLVSNSKGFMSHILSGVTRMIPFIIFSGITYTILQAIALHVSPPNSDPINNPQSVLDYCLKASQLGFNFFIAISGGFIGQSIAGRAAFAPGMIGAFASSTPQFWWNYNGAIPDVYPEDIHGHHASSHPLQIGWTVFGAVACGFAAGYLVKLLLKIKIYKSIEPAMLNIAIPIIATSIIVFPIVTVLGAPIGYVMNKMGVYLGIAGQIQGVNFLIGFIIGAMVGWDVGGPINKIAVTISTVLIPVDPRLMGAAAASIPIAPLGCGVATLIGGKAFTKDERKFGTSALSLGFFGISEGAIPFVAKRTKITVFCNTVASAIAGGIAFLFFVGAKSAFFGGPIAALVAGINSSPGSLNIHIPSIFNGYLAILWFFLAMGIGIIVHSLMYVHFVRRSNKGKNMFFKKSFKKQHILKKFNKKEIQHI